MDNDVTVLYNKMKLGTNIQINRLQFDTAAQKISLFTTPLNTNSLPVTVQQHLDILATAYSVSIGLNPSDFYVILYRRPVGTEPLFVTW